MRGATFFGVVALLAVGALLFASSAYRVQEWEQVVITEFGKPVGEPVMESGLHWRTPFVQKIHRFEKRLLEHDGDADQISTREKKNIYIDTFARWRIKDPLLFLKTVKDELGAKKKLDDIIDSETRDAISRHDLIEAIRDTGRTLMEDADVIAASRVDLGGEGAAPTAREADRPVQEIKKGREAILREVLSSAAAKVAPFGIELVDVRLKSINYVKEVRERVFERMISEREQIAAKYRAEGEKRLAEVRGQIERERNRILSEAYRQAETTKGEAEAEAARIYAETYGQDPEFYSFWRTLEIYREAIADNVSLVIGAESELFRLLSGAGVVPAGAEAE